MLGWSCLIFCDKFKFKKGYNSIKIVRHLPALIVWASLITVNSLCKFEVHILGNNRDIKSQCILIITMQMTQAQWQYLKYLDYLFKNKTQLKLQTKINMVQLVVLFSKKYKNQRIQGFSKLKLPSYYPSPDTPFRDHPKLKEAADDN